MADVTKLMEYEDGREDQLVEGTNREQAKQRHREQEGSGQNYREE